MIKNYLKIAVRNLSKNKSYTAINIFGLAIGLASCLLITLYVANELNYDRYNNKADRIYRINSDLQFGGGKMHMVMTSDMMGPLLKQDYPQVEEYARIYNSEGAKLIKKGNDFINEPRVAYVDSTFFDVFTLPAVEGNTHTALNEPNTVVITESTAKKYFNSTNVVGKTVEVSVDNKINPYKVTAVIKDIPKTSHFNFDFLFSMKNANYKWGQLTSHNFITYLLLKPGTDYKVLEQKFPEYVEKHVLPSVKQVINLNSIADLEKAGNTLKYSLMPLTKIHLHSDYSFELSPSGNAQYVYIFSLVAIFILVIACINFMNLSTARSAKRAKEVGIRKVLGTRKKSLMGQFLVESILTAFIALLIAITITYLVLPLFNDVAAKSMQLPDLINWKTVMVLLAIPFVVGTLAGIYPAFYLSSFSPIAVLKGSSKHGFKKSALRNALVIFQFATSIILIVGTIIIYSQLYYIQHLKLGYNKDQVLVVDRAYALNNNVDAFKNEVLSLKDVKSGTSSSFLPVPNSSRNDNTYSTTPVMDAKSGIDMQTWRIDYDYLNTLGMEIVEGRNFSKAYGSDSSAILVTETTARMMGFKNPIGETVYAPTNFNGDNAMLPLKIIGVVKDFHFESMRQEIGPLCMRLQRSVGLLSFKINTSNAQTLVTSIEQKWQKFAPGMPFSYRFLDESFNDMYRSEQRAGTIAIVFAILAVLIACLGLFGLVTYMAEQRTKEIGIRKVLGASVNNMILMLSRDFLLLVLIAAVIAFPIAWWAMSKWLQDYVYRINIGWWVFAVAGIIALLIAFVTVSFQAIKAAIANPVKSLRTE